MQVLIYSENRLFGECLERGLSRQEHIEWTGFAADVDLAVKKIETPETVVLVDLAAKEVTSVVDTLRSEAGVSTILALAVDPNDSDLLLHSARCGFSSFISIDTPLEDLPGIISAATRGEVELAPKAAAGLFRALGQTPAMAVPVSQEVNSALTRREREVCDLVCDGLTNKEIARELNRSVGTVKNHVHAILAKLEVPRRGAIQSRYGQRFDQVQIAARN